MAEVSAKPYLNIAYYKRLIIKA